MRVVVLGAGAVGSLLGARFASGGHSVLLVGRAAHMEAVRARGLRIEGEDSGTVRLEAATSLPSGPLADAVLVTVKTFDLDAALHALARTLPPTPTLLAQNGLGILPRAEGALRVAGWAEPATSTVRGVHSIPAMVVAPGVVRASGRGEFLLPLSSGAARSAIERFRNLLEGSGIPVRTVPSIDREEWRKAIVNAAINPVTALHGVANGALTTDPYRAEALELLHEAVEAARANGVDLLEPELVGDFDRVVRSTAANRSSMLQDLERGRPTEIDAISGEILRRAEAWGLPLPATRATVARLRGHEGGAATTPQPS